MNTERAIALLIIGIPLDLLSLYLAMKWVRRGKGASGIPAIPLFLYWFAVFTSKDPIPYSGHPVLAFRALNFLVMTGFHFICQYGIPVMYAGLFNGRSTLHRAAMRGDINKVKWLLRQGADVNAKDNVGWTPLHLAALNGHVDVARILLDNGAALQAVAHNLYSPLHCAVMGGKHEIVEAIISRGVEPADDEHAPNTAAREGKLAILQTMFPEGVNLTDGLDSELVRSAVIGGQIETAKYLMSRGAKIDVNKRDNLQGSTLLYDMIGYGINKRKAETAEFLISLGADVNVRNDMGYTPLKWALACKQNELAEVLRQHGAIE